MSDRHSWVNRSHGGSRTGSGRRRSRTRACKTILLTKTPFSGSGQVYGIACTSKRMRSWRVFCYRCITGGMLLHSCVAAYRNEWLVYVGRSLLGAGMLGTSTPSGHATCPELEDEQPSPIRHCPPSCLFLLYVKHFVKQLFLHSPTDTLSIAPLSDTGAAFERSC